MKQQRTIALIDMDCFYAQVEQRLQPHLWGKPVAVVQYSNYKGGGYVSRILAASYEARKYGVGRSGMFGDEAKKICPELTLCYVPQCEHSDKADLSRYRDASDEIFNVLNNFDSRIIVEKASIDEAFLDLTELVEFVIESENVSQRVFFLRNNLPIPCMIFKPIRIIEHEYATSLEYFPTTHIADEQDERPADNPEWQYDRVKNLCQWMAKAAVEGGEKQYLEDRGILDQFFKLRLAVGAEIVEQVRRRIKEETQFHCSAGISINKMLSKLICSKHKPKEQTVLSSDMIPTLFRTTNIRSVRNLGGKLGKALSESFNIQVIRFDSSFLFLLFVTSSRLTFIGTMADLSKIPLDTLQVRFPAQATWIYELAKGNLGVDDEEVKPRDKQTSIAVSKNFPIPLTVLDDVRSWLDGLSKEITKRLLEDQVKNKRTAQTLHVNCVFKSQQSGRSFEIKSYSSTAILNMCWPYIRGLNRAKSSGSWEPPIFNISLSAGRFREGIDSSSRQITEWMLQKAEQLVAGVEEAGPSRSADEKSLSPSKILETAKMTSGEVVNPSFKVDEFLPKTIEDIPKDMLNNLPEDIKKEIADYCKHGGSGTVGSSRVGQKSVASKEHAGKKRKKAVPEREVASKKISQFFQKGS
ncbi:unnamed protein product [Enterobius vermicularis]|uniref:DNA polymerase eta n=1 Tax=Enterobius vermicularis TaxID=51028 RepID=A0A0N4V2I5_ENTVE|nr:unnamed protein product [Enterobius vermicularis]